MRMKIHPTVTNPIYQTGDDVYEELPDLVNDKQQQSDATYTDVAPPLPSARYDHLSPVEKLQNHKRESIGSPALVKKPKKDINGDKMESLNIPTSDSAGALSSLSGPEDCYTVMNPAGNITMMPRNNRHSGQQWGSTPAATGEG